jgi:hypothetical protein
LIHGDGIMKLSWHLQEKEKLAWFPRMQRDEMGRNKRLLEKTTVKYTKNEPKLAWVPIEDFYIDPNCSSPDVNDARFCGERKLVTVDDLAALRGLAEWKIPSDAALIELSHERPSRMGDQTKSSVEIFRNGYWHPGMDTTVDPGGKLIELWEYVTEDRLVIVANGAMTLLNMPNTYGFKPYYHAWYGDVLRRFYSQGVCDVTEGEQRLQIALLCARLDELSLTIHRPLIKTQGAKIPQYQLRVQPGRIWEVADASKDLKFMDMPNITQNAYVETNASENRVSKITGQNDIYSTGTPSSGGNSASRTATGIGAQVQAASSRIQYIVENLENTFLEPMLNDLVTLNNLFPPIGNEDVDMIALTRVNIWMRASAKMKSQQMLLQTLPLMLQTLANPGMAAELAMTGEAVSWKDIARVIGDATGYREYADLIRKMTPEEQEARKQPAPADVLRKEMQTERIQGQQMIQRERLMVDSELEREKMASNDQTEDNALLAQLSQVLAKLTAEKDKDKKPNAK